MTVTSDLPTRETAAVVRVLELGLEVGLKTGSLFG
jgi:hypothetical protein